MRQRVKRELGTLVGILVLVGMLAFANGYWRRSGLREQMEAWRNTVEASREESGLELLKWNTLQKTRGGLRSGPTFHEDLKNVNGDRVDIIGFMVPLEKFRGMTEFMLLPFPIECYFCEAPPMKDVVLVQMKDGETTDLVKEPVIINGQIQLNEGPGTKFFYVIKGAESGPGKEGSELTPVTPTRDAIEHLAPMKEEELIDPNEPADASS